MSDEQPADESQADESQSRDQGPAKSSRSRKPVPWRRDPIILARLPAVERRLHAGESNVAMAAALGVGESTIRADLKRLQELWNERTGSTIVELRQQRLRQLDHIVQRSLAAADWDMLCEKAVLFGVMIDVDGTLREVERDVKGAAQFRGQKSQALGVARQAIMDMAKLEGLVVDKLAPTDPDGAALDLATLLKLARSAPAKDAADA